MRSLTASRIGLPSEPGNSVSGASAWAVLGGTQPGFSVLTDELPSEQHVLS